LENVLFIVVLLEDLDKADDAAEAAPLATSSLEASTLISLATLVEKNDSATLQFT
jgi:hypothetical protein